MRQVGNYNSAQLALTDFIQENNRITLNGEAIDSTVITRGSSTLEASAIFTRVVIQSIKTPTPATGTPVAALTPAVPVALPPLLPL